MSEISNITEASAAVVKGQPRPVSLSDGTVLQVGRINWLQFNDIFNELVGPLGAMFGSQAQGSQMIPGMAMMSANTMTAAVTALVRSSPEAIKKLIIHSVPSVTAEQIETWFWADPLMVGMEAFKLNFIEQDKLLSFFVGIGNALSELSLGQSPSEDPAEDTPKPPTKS